MSGSLEPTPVELHLGDRLSALIDGELDDEPRDRVLAHLATCPGCKAEADAQRRIKSVCAGSAPPPPSDGLLARLQGLPGSDLDELRERPAPGPLPGLSIHYPLAPGASGSGQGPLPGSVFGSSRGFRTHRPTEAERVLRGRRFAFAAAGAVSLAAVALGGVVTSGPGGAGGATTASPARVPAAGVERGERRGEAAYGAERAADPYARSTTHSSPLGSLGQPVGSVSEGARHAGTGTFAAGRGLVPLLSPPLVLAAGHRGELPTGRVPGAQPGATPHAMPSANGSPAGPQPPAGDPRPSGEPTYPSPPGP